MSYEQTRKVLCAQQWEITKGHLLATISLAGGTYGREGYDKFCEFKKMVEGLIKNIEDNELYYG